MPISATYTIHACNILYTWASAYTCEFIYIGFVYICTDTCLPILLPLSHVKGVCVWGGGGGGGVGFKSMPFLRGGNLYRYISTSTPYNSYMH